MKETVWAFNQVDDEDAKRLVYESIKNGKSRFGWSSEDENNLKLKNNWSEHHSRQLFLLEIKKQDWIVHINTPEWGKCIAGQVTSEYDFDEGLQCEWGADFRHHFSIDPKTIIEFERSDPNVLPSVNLYPRQRYHRVYEVKNFLQSIENLKKNSVNLSEDENREEHHLKDRTLPYLQEITRHIHETHKGKKLERFLAKVMREIPGVEVQENGSRWGTDHGADLIVTLQSSVGPIACEHKIIVQVKSFEGQHYDEDSVDQIKAGIKEYDGAAGLLITTGERTEGLEKKISAVSDKIGRPINSLCGEEVAMFVIQNAPDLLFKS